MILMDFRRKRGIFFALDFALDFHLQTMCGKPSEVFSSPF